MARGRSSPKAERSTNVVGFSNLRSKYSVADTEIMPTGIITVDVLLGGGFPRGKMVELCGQTGTGKTTLMAAVSKFLCSEGRRVHWWDYEHSLTAGLKSGVGLDAYEGDKFFHLEPTTYGDAEELLDGMATEDYPDMIVVDSETAMLPDRLGELSILNMEPGIKARMCSNFLLKYKGWVKGNNICMVFINQMRTKISFHANQTVEDSAGGNAFKFYMDVRLRMRRIADLVREEMTVDGKKKVIYGAETAVWAVKNREVRSHIELNLPVVFGKGVSAIQIIKNLLVNSGYVVSAGSYFKINLPSLGFEGQAVQGNKGIFQFIKENRVGLENFIKEEELLFLSKEIVE